MSKQRWLRAGLLGLLSLIMLLIAGGMVQAESLDTEIVLHKRVYRDVRSPEDVWYPNDGGTD